METLNIAVIGYGGMGSYHANELAEKEEKRVKIYGVYDLDSERIDKAVEFGHKVYQSLEEVLRDEKVEAVLIATPNDSHKELAIASLEAGKHVICEKPVTLSIADFDEIVAVANQNNRVFMTHQNRRWDSDFLIVRDLYQKEQIGSLFQVESRVHGGNGIPGDWRHLEAHGGGMLLDWGVHLLDQLLFMVASPIKSVFADLSYVLGDEVDDGFISYITFENGFKGVIEVGTSNFVKLPRWYLKGYRGTGLIQDWDLSGELVVQKENAEKVELVPIQAGQGMTKTMAPPSEEMTDKLALPKVEADFPAFYTNFYEVVREKAEPIVKNSEVRDVLKLIDVIFESAETGQVINY